MKSKKRTIEPTPATPGGGLSKAQAVEPIGNEEFENRPFSEAFLEKMEKLRGDDEEQMSRNFVLKRAVKSKTMSNSTKRKMLRENGIEEDC